MCGNPDIAVLGIWTITSACMAENVDNSGTAGDAGLAGRGDAETRGRGELTGAAGGGVDHVREIALLRDQLGKFTSAAARQAEQDRAKELADLKARADAAEGELRTARTKEAFGEAASKARVKNPAKLFSIVGGAIQYDDAGKPKNIAAVVEQARKDYPEEFGAAGSSVDAGAQGKGLSPGAGVDDFIRKALS
jgi:hypothetical protein